MKSQRNTYDLGFRIYATEGTADVLKKYGIDAVSVKKIHESKTNNTLTLIESGKIQYVISTSAKGRIPSRDSVKIRRKTVERNIPCLTSLDTANALADCLKSHYSQHSTELIDINHMREEKLMLKFTKMQGIGNDYIYCSTFDQEISNPEALAVRLSDRHFGIGGDGIILVCPSKVADAKMKMYNLDGSEGKMCGNGIRCVGKFLYDHGMVDINEKDEITIETLSGIKKLKDLILQAERLTVSELIWARLFLNRRKFLLFLTVTRLLTDLLKLQARTITSPAYQWATHTA